MIFWSIILSPEHQECLRREISTGEGSPWLGPKKATKPEGDLPKMCVLGDVLRGGSHLE